MKTKTTLAALLLAAVIVTPSYGADKHFLKGAAAHYRDSPNNYSWYFCGYVDSLVWNKWYSIPSMAFHYPSGMKNGQLRDVVAKYIHEHPEKHHESNSQLIRNAIREAWPSKNERWAKTPSVVVARP